MDDEPQATQGRQSAWTARKRHGGLIAAVSVVVAATVHGAAMAHAITFVGRTKT
jgi:uncharacterized membrane protein